MALQIGAKVKFLNEEGGGKITQLIDKDTVMVLSEVHDFEIPVLIKEIILLERVQNADKESINLAANSLRSRIAERLELMFAHEENKIICYLLNDKESALSFGVFEQKGEGNIGLYSGILQPKAMQKIASYSLKEFEAISQWRVQGFSFEKHPEEIATPLDCVVKVHPKKLFQEGNKKFVAELGIEALVINLEATKEQLKLQAQDLFADQPAKQSTKKANVQRKDTRELLEVDLHIHELLETTRGMSNGEMLDYQLDTFRKTLDENKKYKGKHIVFIHGVGNGVLKQRIRHELQKYPRYVVQDASFQEYGWGATMVIIK